ncbi:rubrerythrin family protein [[Clostridium] polysaccharolyticum]|uniref:Rubrerythrin n=1 Tax=[Clostridium] polysaccharolyticum TaxID=29364 RepID=A0A1I0FFE1_9FIRM|nr:rubrerythrin family protein [[Clostridium] polysaccharolyticum]SET56811.1 Rubrerythrin [[Clostridium] polysaccharolyticum]
MDFKTSETKDNLMRAFAGESQARNRYTFAAEEAKKQKQEVLEKVFLFTAEQERAHAKVFYQHLKELAGETIHIDGGYPVDLSENLLELLKRAQHNEYEESDDVYIAFGDKAKEEGFPQVASSFYNIAGIEKVHGNRFGRFAKWLEENSLYVASVSQGFMCLNCGYIYEGEQAPKKCPVCGVDQGYFIRLQLAPYTDESK